MESFPRCHGRLSRILLQTGVQSWCEMLEWTSAQCEGIGAFYPYRISALTNNLQLDLTCGTENTLLTVVELEKCEYLFTGTTPALCLPLDEDKESRKDEL